MNFFDEKTAFVSKNYDLSDDHYQVLTHLFEALGKDIQSNLVAQLRSERDYRLSRYNQNLLMQLPKHMLIAVKSKIKKACLSLEPKERFDVYDIQAKKQFHYSNLSEVNLTCFKVDHVDLTTTSTQVSLQTDAPTELNHNVFDLWVNPLLWKQGEFKLCQLKEMLLKENKIKVCVIYDDGTQKEVLATVYNSDAYTLGLNDKTRLDLLSPEFSLKLSIELSQIPVTETTAKVKEMMLMFPVGIYDRADFFELISQKDRLFITNVIPLFNLFEAYSTSQKIDERYDKIPLLHPEDPEARACYVHQVWVNNQPYKDYYNHTVSEYVFHKHVGKLSYSPKDINEALDIEKRIFAKVEWTQKAEHGSLIKVSTNSFNTQSAHFELIALKSELRLNSFRHIDRVVQVFRAFSDLDIRNNDGFLLALKFLYGEENAERYQFFKSVIKSVNYDHVSNVLVIEAAYPHYYAYVRYVANVVTRFFYINSPQVVEVKVLVK
ncbi:MULTISPECIES: type VI secretion system baseplate subunit TssF/IglH [Cysteiniphilum]|uniref:type VI secretion system baseplate subunit TssF/IglH n=1 Tax=Cysteiniphilum TaxID=2056696 RepID=UPI00177BA821|nr:MULTISPECIES: type VI secretion system baseplate subunit TssF/IglH [Cysteiniphilum]